MVADFSHECMKAHANIMVAKTAVANARCKVAIGGESDVSTTSPPNKLWMRSRTIATAKAWEVPEGRGFIFHTAAVLIKRRTPVTIVNNL